MVISELRTLMRCFRENVITNFTPEIQLEYFKLQHGAMNLENCSKFIQKLQDAMIPNDILLSFYVRGYKAHFEEILLLLEIHDFLALIGKELYNFEDIFLAMRNMNLNWLPFLSWIQLLICDFEMSELLEASVSDIYLATKEYIQHNMFSIIEKSYNHFTDKKKKVISMLKIKKNRSRSN